MRSSCRSRRSLPGNRSNCRPPPRRRTSAHRPDAGCCRASFACKDSTPPQVIDDSGLQLDFFWRQGYGQRKQKLGFPAIACRLTTCRELKYLAPVETSCYWRKQFAKKIVPAVVVRATNTNA